MGHIHGERALPGSVATIFLTAFRNPVPRRVDQGVVSDEEIVGLYGRNFLDFVLRHTTQFNNYERYETKP